MPEHPVDQASGLRRLFVAPPPAVVLLASGDAAQRRQSMNGLAEALGRRGRCALADSGGSTVAARGAIRLFDDPSRLADTEVEGSRLIVLVHGIAGPAGLKPLYREIKALVEAARIDHLGVLLAGRQPAGVEQRCRENLASAVARFVGAQIDIWANLSQSTPLRPATGVEGRLGPIGASGSAEKTFDHLADSVLDATRAGPRARAH